MAGLTPTQRTLRALREQGRVCAIAEKWNPHVPRPGGGKGVRQDLFGWIDVVALCPGKGIVGIQSTGQAFAEHVRRMLDGDCTAAVIEWLHCGGVVEVWGWRKLLVKRGGRAKRWAPRVREITMADFRLGNEPVLILHRGKAYRFEWAGAAGWLPINRDGSERLSPVPKGAWEALKGLRGGGGEL